MAGDWFPVRTDLHDDPAVAGICRLTGLDEDAVVGKLVRLWGWANGQTADGRIPHVSKDWIDAKVKCPSFADAMQSVNWLVLKDEAGIVIPKFGNWNGHSAKERLQSALRMRSLRSKRNKNEQKRNHRTGEERREESTSSSSDSDDVPKKKRARFIPPTVDEVRTHCLERGNTIDPEAFVAFYESVGWHVGKKPMKDWRAAVRTWERRQAQDGKAKTISPKPLTPEQMARWNPTTGIASPE
jgi:hypothetical protein